EPTLGVPAAPIVGWGNEPTPRQVRPLIPARTVALAFVSSLNDATKRAVNHAETLEASETRAVYFELDPEEASRIQESWVEERMRIPLDIVEAPFRDLARPMLEEGRRFTYKPGTPVI